MSVFWWLGYAIGILAMAVAPAALVLLLAVRPVRRWWLRPLLRRVTARQPERVAYRTTELELELDGRVSLNFPDGISYRSIEQMKRARLQAMGARWVEILPPTMPPAGPPPRPRRRAYDGRGGPV